MWRIIEGNEIRCTPTPQKDLSFMLFPISCAAHVGVRHVRTDTDMHIMYRIKNVPRRAMMLWKESSSLKSSLPTVQLLAEIHDKPAEV
jgi:hypothetical protein